MHGADLQEAGLPAELDGVVYVKKMQGLFQDFAPGGANS